MATSLGRLGIVLISLLLIWRIVWVNAVLRDESGMPRAALPGAAPGSSETEMLQRVLAGNPAEVAALLLIARELEMAGHSKLASQAYRAALRIAPLDQPTLETSAGFLLRQGDPAAVEIVARLVAEHPQSREAGLAVLTAMLASAAARPLVAKALDAHPAWESDFLAHACRAGADPRHLTPLVLARARAGKPHATELACLVERLKKEGLWSHAHQLWLNLLPRARLGDVGYVFNGGFEFPLQAGGFDWTLAAGAERETGHAAEIRPVQGASGRAALRVSYNGRRQFGIPAWQHLVLPPGRYEVTGQVRTDGLKSLRGVQWTVRCMSEGLPAALLGHSERFLGSSEWRPFSAPVEIGAQCAGQILQLEPAIDEGNLVFISGLAWFDDLRMRRIAN